MQASLGKLLAAAGAGPPRGFYFGYYGPTGRPVEKSAGSFQGYFFDHSQGWGMGFGIPLLTEVMETFCSADHGLTIGYQADPEGTYHPILQEDRTNSVMSWGLPLLHQSILAMAEALWLRAPDVDLEADLRPATERVLREFWLSPTPEEARAWSSFPFEQDQAGGEWKSLTHPLGMQDVWGIFRRGKPPQERVFWEAGAWATTPSMTRKLLRAAKLMGTYLRGW
jgi:hypothetical protein